MDELFVKKEKERARLLRKTRWWQNKIAQAICNYCQKQLSKDEVTMDHIVPLSQGGQSTKSNVCICCKACNNKKKDADLLSWTQRNCQ